MINTIKKENPEIWTQKFQDKVTALIKESVELEKAYAYDACPQGVLGINPQQFCNYVEHMADRRLERIDLPKVFNKPNPFPWMEQSTDLAKEKNFFETRVTEYQTGTLTWDK